MSESMGSRPAATVRLIIMAASGVAAGVTVGALAGWQYAPISGWVVACVVYTAWVWLRIGRMDAATTKKHATQEDPTRARADLVTLVATIASLGAIGYLVVSSSQAKGAIAIIVAGLSLASVAMSWFVVHTLFTLRYAELYYSKSGGGVDFAQKDPPCYSDFAYLSFTIGMTYQVSDTNLTDHRIRVTALRQGLLSYLLGAVILGATINLLVGLAK